MLSTTFCLGAMLLLNYPKHMPFRPAYHLGLGAMLLLNYPKQPRLC